ncbi:MAG: hypothetical protein M3N91_02110 [Pseudomonadota bacterium]|nr:hypothetical protein [Pseudomonadota bacterium]
MAVPLVQLFSLVLASRGTTQFKAVMVGKIINPFALPASAASYDIDMSVTVEAASVFPGLVASDASMKVALSDLSRNDALFFCARINTIVSGFGGSISRLDRQRAALALLNIPEEVKTLEASIARSGIKSEPAVFFRGQLLELTRWIGTYCTVHSDEPNTFEQKTVRSAFLRAALIASELWSKRIYGARLTDEGGSELQLQRALGAFRKGTEEGNEAPHPGAALGHGWILFSKHMRARLTDFDDLFEASTGLTLEQYYACAFGVMQKTFVQNANSGIFSTAGFGAATNIGEVFDAFVNLKSQSPDDLVTALTNPVAVTGYKALRERPILNFSDNRSAILDPVTYFDTLTISPLFAVVKQAGPARTNEIFSAFGMAFEDYTIGFLEGMYPSGLLARRLIPRAKGKIAHGKEIEVDSILTDITSLVVFEMKASWIREETILDANHQVFLEQLRKLYGISSDPENRPKGVAQLANTIGSILRHEWSGEGVDYSRLRTIYPVLLVHDDRMGVAGMGKFLDDEFKRALNFRFEQIYVHPLIVMTITDLENLATSVEEFSLREFLQDYSIANPERLRSIRNFMATSPKYVGKIRPSREVVEATFAMGERIKAELFPRNSNT